MSGFKCPFCGNNMSLQRNTVTSYRLNFFGMEDLKSRNPYLEVDIYRCPNDDCKKETIYAAGINGYIDGCVVPIYPPAVYTVFPDYVPQAVRTDYEEACMVVSSSPKSAATLCRRCLQGMIRDFWGINGKNLNVEISQLADKVPASQWKAIDAIRSIGNIGAHMEKDVNLIIDVEPEEAQKLIRLIEHLIEKWYIDRHDAESLYSEITAIAEEKEESRFR